MLFRSEQFPGHDQVSSQWVVSSGPDDGTVNVQPRARPWQLPRTRRGMNLPGSISVQGATGSVVDSTGAKCGPSGLARNSCRGVSDIGCDLFQKLTTSPSGNQPSYERGRGITSTSHPFDVGMPVPSVSPPISRQVGGP